MIDTSQNMLYHIGNLNTENQRISYQMATGKNLDKGSENSILHSNLIDLDDKLRVTEGLMLQITKTKVNVLYNPAYSEKKFLKQNLKKKLIFYMQVILVTLNPGKHY